MNQIPEAMSIVNAGFEKEMAPLISQPCAESFRMFAKTDTINQMIGQGMIHLWGAFDEYDRMIGVAALNNPAHVSILYVAEEHRRQGISRAFLDTMAHYGVLPNQENILTVNALGPSKAYFEHVGFVPCGPEQQMLGENYTPMQKGAAMPAVHKQQVMYQAPKGVFERSKMPAWLKVVIGLICVLAVAIFIYSFNMIVRKTYESAKDSGQNIEQYLKPYMNPGDEDNSDTDEGSGEDSGIEAIPEYMQKDLSYEISEEKFSENNKDDKYIVSLSVGYPTLSGLKKNEEEINKKIKDFALETEKQIYEKGNIKDRERIIKLDQVYVFDQVDYKVSYATDEFISIVFNDAYIFGEATDQWVKVRTLNIDLTTGEVYKLQDVFNIEDDGFIETWEKSLKDEAGETLGKILPDLGKDNDIKVLSGEDENYPNAFFVDKDGVEIGFSILGEGGKGGWVTAPIDKDEIIKYKTSSDFWKKVTWK